MEVEEWGGGRGRGWGGEKKEWMKEKEEGRKGKGREGKKKIGRDFFRGGWFLWYI